MAPQTRTSTRVTLTMRHAGRVRVFDDVRRHWLVLVPQATVWHAKWTRPAAKRKARWHAKGKSRPTPHGRPHGASLGAAHWDPWQRAIAIPYQGHFPSYHLGKTSDPPRVFVDFAASGPRYPQKAVVKAQPSLVRFETASRGPDAMRVVLVFRHATPTRVEDDRVRHEVLILPEHRAQAHGATAHRAPQVHAAAPAPQATEMPRGDQDPTLAAP